MATETYISESEINGRFRIEQAYKPDFGAWLALRWLYSITATGGKVWHHIVFYLLFTLLLSPLALAADLSGIVAYGLLLLAKKILEGFLLAIIHIGQTVVTRFLGTAALIAAAVGSVLIIYYQWDVITDFIKGLFG
ncbi:MAG: hypothetical protein K6F33_00280 [Bacteroidales bacterium]|nr:hypothetical protein [Bacteroidales bacterium]